MPPTKTAKRLRFVKNQHPGAKRPEPRITAPEPRARRSPRAESATDFPGWKDLADGNQKDFAGRQEEGRLAGIPTLRMAGFIALFAAVTTVYVGHVHATQQLADRVQALSRENLTLHLHYNQVKGRYDQATAPSVISSRARLLGLTESVPNGFPILSSP
jgi:hypothetical protein